MVASHEDMRKWANAHRGENFSQSELKRFFGYSPTTYFRDTHICNYVILIRGTNMVQIVGKKES